ncbi:MAG TPA: RHS repeat-associated core domain-containing protein [Pyrinomonadaceae bacterium]|nr:RHS repeat-associated core domain-containing protein [Pyrinomonadaceae bacterium]
MTSNQTSNGSSAQRRFAYDRWGNRTGVWDATSGGTQIESIALQGSGGIPTNQIASVTAGSTLNYAYDAAGNVTNDGAHTYGYDSENRMVTVDGGSTANYAYDHQNRRYKKTVGPTVTHYVWQGSQVIAEHNGGTGSVIVDYVHSGSRMIAKVSGGTTEYLLSDRLSTRIVLNGSGTVLGRQNHLPFGGDLGESGTQEKHHFTSYEKDTESGTDYALNRQYSQSVGRFNRVDLVRGSIGNPQELNRYAYVQADPINRSDRLGLYSSAVECYIDWRGCDVCYNKNTGEVVSRNCVSGAPGMPEPHSLIGDSLGPLLIETEAETPKIEPEPPVLDLERLRTCLNDLFGVRMDSLLLGNGTANGEFRGFGTHVDQGGNDDFIGVVLDTTSIRFARLAVSLALMPMASHSLLDTQLTDRHLALTVPTSPETYVIRLTEPEFRFTSLVTPFSS